MSLLFRHLLEKGFLHLDFHTAANNSRLSVVEAFIQWHYLLVIACIVAERWVNWNVLVLVTTDENYPAKVVYQMTVCQIKEKTFIIGSFLVIEILNCCHLSYSTQTKESHSNQTTIQLPNTEMRRSKSQEKVEFMTVSYTHLTLPTIYSV